MQNATRLIENTAVGTAHSISTSVATTSVVHSLSVYAKPNGRNFIYLYVGSGVGQGTIIDIANGVKGNNVGNAPNSTTIEDAGNGWKRCTITFNGIAATPTPTVGLANSLTSFTYTGDGTSGVFIYGFQCEAGSYPTSLIPTYGTSATRTIDECSKTGISSLIGSSEGTLFYEFDIQNLSEQDNNPIIISAKDSGSTDNVYIQTRADGGVRGIYYAGGSVEGFTNSGSGYLSDGNHKIAFGYKENDFVLYIDGIQIDTDTSGATSGSFDELYLGYYNNSFNPSINSKQALLFNTRLSNSDLATLTQ